MDNITILNPASTTSQLEEAISNRFSKSKALVSCLMYAMEFTRNNAQLDDSTIYHVLWTVEDFLEKISQLKDKL